MIRFEFEYLFCRIRNKTIKKIITNCKVTRTETREIDANKTQWLQIRTKETKQNCNPYRKDRCSFYSFGLI